jgi:hypothetical protein
MLAMIATLPACDGHTAATPDHPSAVGSNAPAAATTAAAPTASSKPTTVQDPALTPGPSVACKSDADCVPMTPCGMTEPGMCVHRSQVNDIAVECPKPKKSTYRCACEASQCASKPITP